MSSALALSLLMFLLLARFLSNAGIPQALAGAFGSAAPYASRSLARISPLFIGTNVGSKSTMMPLQADLGRLAGMVPAALPAIQNGKLFLQPAPQVVGMVAGLAGRVVVPAAV